MSFKLSNIFRVAMVFMICELSVAQTKNTTVEFEAKSHNFGKIEESAGYVSCVFKFKNTGDIPFVINTIGVSCGCTTPQWNKAPVMPGKSGEITVTFDPLGRPGIFEKSINITCNAGGGSIKLLISGDVKPRPRTIIDDYPFPVADGLRITDRSVSMGNIPRLEVTYKELPIANNSDKEINIDIDRSLLPGYIIVKARKATLAPRERSEIIVKYDATKTDIWGEDVFFYSLIVNGVKQEDMIMTRAVLIENFKNLTKEQLKSAPHSEFSSYFYHFSTQPKNAVLSRNFTVSNSGQDDLKIRYIDFNSEKLDVTCSNDVVKAGGTATISVKIKSTKESGQVAENIKVITNDPQMPVRDIRVVATIQ